MAGVVVGHVSVFCPEELFVLDRHAIKLRFVKAFTTGDTGVHGVTPLIYLAAYFPELELREFFHHGDHGGTRGRSVMHQL